MGELLTVVAEQAADACVLSVKGEIDLSTAATLEQAVATAVDQADKATVIVDLSQVGFLSSAGISALLKTKQYGEDHDVTMRIVVPQDASMRRSLEITGLLEILPVFPSREAALAG